MQEEAPPVEPLTEMEQALHEFGADEVFPVESLQRCGGSRGNPEGIPAFLQGGIIHPLYLAAARSPLVWWLSECQSTA
jgi:hypothetical protein